MPQDLDALEKLCAAATPLPWCWDDSRHIPVQSGDPATEILWPELDRDTLLACINGMTVDIQYLMAACNAMPELIAEVRRLRRCKVCGAGMPEGAFHLCMEHADEEYRELRAQNAFLRAYLNSVPCTCRQEVGRNVQCKECRLLTQLDKEA